MQSAFSVAAAGFPSKVIKFGRHIFNSGMQINGSTIEIQLTAEPVFPHPSFLPYLYPSLLSSLLPFPMSLLPSFLPSQVSEWTLKSFCSSKKATLGKAGVSMLHLPPLRLRQGGDPHSLPMAKDWSMHPS